MRTPFTIVESSSITRALDRVPPRSHHPPGTMPTPAEEAVEAAAAAAALLAALADPGVPEHLVAKVRAASGAAAAAGAYTRPHLSST